MAEASQVGVDTDNNFVGFSSRLDPSNLKPGFAQSSNNMRLQRGIAQPRKGCERMSDDTLNQNLQFGSGYYVNSAGEDNVVMIFHDGIVLYNTQRNTFSQKYTFPAGRFCPIGKITSQTYDRGTYIVAPITIPPSIPVTHYISFAVVPTTIGVNIGDKLTIGFTSLDANLIYVNFNVINVTNDRIVFYDSVSNPYPIGINSVISLTVNSFSFEPEIVQALDNLYIFRGQAGEKITATVSNPQIQNNATVTVTVTTTTPHGLRVGSEFNLIDTITPYQHPYFHKNFI